MKIFSFLLMLTSIFCASAGPFTKIVSRKGPSGGRIIGGRTAHPLQFPYAAAIYVQTTTSRYFCSGSLLSNLWVLTAGQCVDGATLFQVLLGSIKLSNDPAQLEVATSTFVLHPEYNPLTLISDIGLIRFRMAITFSDYIKPIDRLPLSEVPDYLALSTFGWGQISDDDPGLSDELQWVSVVTVTNDDCAITYGGQIDPKMICVEGNFNEGTCYGDIGSALVQYYSTSEAIPVAVSSFISSNGCESTDPSGYTRTYPYNDWIRSATELNI